MDDLTPFQTYRKQCEFYQRLKPMEGGGGDRQCMLHGCDYKHRNDDECHALSCAMPWHLQTSV